MNHVDHFTENEMKKKNVSTCTLKKNWYGMQVLYRKLWEDKN